MTILLQWLVEHAWIFYIVCAIGVIIYAVRALAAHRERRLALFTLEQETATAQAIRSWAIVFVFVAIGALIFASTAFILPSLPEDVSETSRPTPTMSAGVELLTPAATPTPSPTLGIQEATSTTTTTVPTAPSTELTEPPTLAPTDTPTPAPAASGEIRVRFGDFAELVSYSLPATEVTTAQPLQLTVRWRALQGTDTQSYLVFTHLLSEGGSLIAQHDGPPASGTRPTTGWVAGETIEDPHPLTFYDIAYTGSARIAVGLYDPATGRVLTETGDDYVILPTTIVITSQ
jgi:hypothetical protein